MSYLVELRRREVARLETSKPGTLRLAAAYNDLGSTYLTILGDPAQALVCLEKALEIYERKSRKSVNIASTYHNIGDVFFKQADFDQAKTYFDKEIKIFERKKPMSMELADAYEACAYSLFLNEDYHEASDYYEKVTEIYQRKWPQSMPLANVYDVLGMISVFRGSNDTSQTWFEKSYEIYQVESPFSAGLAEIGARLANSCYDQDKIQARRYYDKALAVISFAPPPSTSLAAAYTNLGFYVQKQGDKHLARSYFESALKLDEEEDPGSIKSADDCYDQGLVLYEMGERNAALEFYHKALAFCENQRAEKRPIFIALRAFVEANSCFGIGQVLDDEGDYQQSLTYYEKARDLHERCGPHRLQAFFHLDPRALPTHQVIQEKVRLNPGRLLSFHQGLLPAVWCHVFAKLQNDVQAVYYLLREQPHLVVVS